MSTKEKQRKRAENKKRKITALLAVAELNDADIKRRKVQSSDKLDEPKGCEDTQERATQEKTTESDGDDGSNKLTVELDTGKSTVSGEDYIELKNRLRERKKMLKSLPLFRLKSVGEDALVNRESRVPLLMSDIQALLTFCICGDRSTYRPHRWCKLEKWNRLSNIVCVVVEGLGVTELEKQPEELAWVTSSLNMMEVMSPASYDSSVAEDLALIPISSRQQSKLIEAYGSLENACDNESPSTLKAVFPVGRASSKKMPVALPTSPKLKLLLGIKQMIMENYPLHMEGVQDNYKDFVFTKDNYTEVHEGSPLFSIDCEMCLTSEGMELTRVCAVNEKLEVVYHSLVKPEREITNYLTQFSGITSEILEGVETRLSEVQNALREILPADCILVGQSLNSDLIALKMMHPYVIDTSVIFNITGERRRKSRLALLSQIFLNQSIQTQGKLGHSPEEDAKAAMSLVLLKLREGYTFGDVLLGGRVPGIHEPVQQPPPQQTQPSQPAKTRKLEKLDIVHKDTPSSLITSAADKIDKTVCVTVSDSCAEAYSNLASFTHQLKLFQTGSGVKEMLAKSKVGALEHNLSISHLDLRHEAAASISKACKRTEKYCREMYSHTSTNGIFLLILAGAQGNNAAVGVKLNTLPDR